MSAKGDKRSVSTDALETLGTIITDGGRDAIHLAVEPVVAGETLYAGEHIGIVNGRAIKRAKKHLGIVDPFLNEPVERGQKFWLVVFPRQITSLRHVWSHPDFPESEVDSNKFVKKNELDELVEASRNWIESYAAHLGLGYEELMVAAADYQMTGDYLNKGSLLESEYVSEEFWDHYEIVIGKPVKQKGNFFSCSC
jgi:hypothetical protein